MNIVLKLFAVLLLGLLVAACGDNGDDGGNGGNGDGGDAAAIESLLADFFSAVEDGDAPGLAGLFSDQCGDMEDAAEATIELFQSAGDVEFDLTGVDVQNLEEDSAEVLPEGSLTIAGQEGPLAEEGDEYTEVVKEDGDWKIGDCSFLG